MGDFDGNIILNKDMKLYLIKLKKSQSRGSKPFKRSDQLQPTHTDSGEASKNRPLPLLLKSATFRV